MIRILEYTFEMFKHTSFDSINIFDKRVSMPQNRDGVALEPYFNKRVEILRVLISFSKLRDWAHDLFLETIEDKGFKLFANELSNALKSKITSSKPKSCLPNTSIFEDFNLALSNF